MNDKKFVLELFTKWKLEDEEDDKEGKVLLINFCLIDKCIAKIDSSASLHVVFDFHGAEENEKREFFQKNLTRYSNHMHDCCLTHGKSKLDCSLMFSVLEDNTTVMFTGEESEGLNKISLFSEIKHILELKFYVFDTCSRSLAFDNVVLGGTFDRLHLGHKKLLSASLMCANKRVVIGITNDQMLRQKSDVSMIQPLNQRVRSVQQFCAAFDSSIKCEPHEISDPFGPSIVDQDLQAIVVSSETLKGARMVNDKRVQNGLNELQVVAVLRSNNHTLSSTFLRNLDNKEEKLNV
eukprot:augustus_masked-scaffold_19-processed-gene-6.12-mRNA-1 protein AED:0.19 eAED:0.19 QI:0/-1/0/1/-1/1/1/0/292